MKKFFVMSVVSLVILCLASPSFAQSNNDICHITYQEFKKVKPKKIRIIDVRTAEEYQQGHLKKARNIDVLQSGFKDKIEKLNKKASYYVYCRSGKRSAKAAGIMENEGFSKVCSIDGGMLNMQKEGAALVK